MILKEKGLTVSEWLTTYNLTKGGRKSSCPCNLSWLYWDINPNRIPLANDVIYEILSSITSDYLKDNYHIYISEEAKKDEEIITVALKKSMSTPQSIIIRIAPLAINISIDDSTSEIKYVCTNKEEAIIKLNNIKISDYRE